MHMHADPRAANLLVQVKNGRASPVLLDFGMTVRLSEAQVGIVHVHACARGRMHACARGRGRARVHATSTWG